MSRRDLHKIAKLIAELNCKVKALGAVVEYEIRDGVVFAMKVRLEPQNRLIALVDGDGRVETFWP